MKINEITNTPIPFVKRQYMNSNTCEIFYYTDLKISNIATHYHSHYEIYFFLEGDVKYFVDNKEYKLNKGDFLVIPPNTIHGPNITNKNLLYSRFVLWVDTEYFNKIHSLISALDYGFKTASQTKNYKFHIDYIQHNELLGHFLDLWHEYNYNNIFKESNILNYITTIILNINKIIYENSSNKVHSPKKELYTQIFEYINNNITEDLTLENIANTFYVSKYYISHIFKDHLGISIYSYIIKKRLYGCKIAISAGEPITSVAKKYGFSDYTSFYRAFKKEYGISPKDYQKQSLLK